MWFARLASTILFLLYLSFSAPSLTRTRLQAADDGDTQSAAEFWTPMNHDRATKAERDIA